MIPFKKQRIRCKELSAIKEVLKSDLLSGFRANKAYNLGGRKVQELEEAICSYFGVKYAVTMNSATSCLHAAVVACGGGSVVVPPLTFSASASSILMAGGMPVFTDVDTDTFNLNAKATKNRISLKTKSIMAVHWHGNPARMQEILAVANKYSLKVIEDASQAMGAEYYGVPVGTIGDCGVFSLNQFKNIHTGEGGVLVTNDAEIARVARLMRNHGETQSEILGYNYRMTELTAILALERFKRLDEVNSEIRELAEYTSSQLKRLGWVTPPFVLPNCQSVYCNYAIKVDTDVSKLQEKLLRKGIYWGSDTVAPLYDVPFYQRYRRGCPNAESLKDSLMFTNIIKPPMTKRKIDNIVKIIEEAYG